MVSIKDLRVMPNSLDAEKSALSCILLEPSLMSVTILKNRHFACTDYKKIFKSMLKAHKDNREISVMTVKDIAGEEYADMLWDIASYAITSTIFEESQKMIIEKYNRRRIIIGCNDLIASAYNNDYPIDDLMFKASVLGSDVDSIDETKTLVAGSFDTMMKFFDAKEQPAIVSDMGYDFLSAILGGRRAGALYIIAGATGQGKSTFALNLCIEALKRGVKCSFFSTEMPAHEIHTRLLAREAKVESWEIEQGCEDIVEGVMDTMTDIQKWSSDCNIYDDFDTKENLERLIAKEASTGSKIIFIDYIQQVRMRGTNRNLAIGDMTTMFKKMAIRYGVAIVGLSQLNRASQDSAEPSLRDLRDSGSIEQDADVVMFVHGFDPDVTPTTAGIHVLKNRQGERGMAHLPYYKKYFLFTNPRR